MLTEDVIIKQVSYRPEIDVIEVQWSDRILRDGDVISESYRRKAYQRSQVDEFISEVDGAGRYVIGAGWN